MRRLSVRSPTSPPTPARSIRRWEQPGSRSVQATPFFLTPVYNIVPPPDEAGLLAFKIILFGTPQFTILSARTGGDYGLDAKVTSIVHGPFPLAGFQQVLWGVPADPSHDVFREDPQEVSGEGNIGPAYFGDFCDAEGALSTSDPNTIVKPCHTGGKDLPPIASHSPTVPFLQAPTTCDGPLTSTLDVLSYDGGETNAESAWPQGTGCDQLSFNPSLFAQPTTRETDAPSGIDVNLQVPQQLSPTIPSPTELRGATVTLPPGFSINPNAADGKTSCSDSEARFGTEEAGLCPEFSKVGSLKIESSALPGPLPGSVYLGQPLPGNRYRIFLVADGFATHIKLAGTVTPDPATGQLDDHIPEPAAEPADRLRHALLRLRAGSPRDPDAVRHLSRDVDLHPLGLESGAPDLDPVLHARLGAGRRSLSGPRFDRSPRAFRPPPPATPPARTLRSGSK